MNNTLEDGEIKVERSNNCTVMYNTISLGRITISGTSYYSANYNVVARNTITSGPGNGIELFTADYNIIAENYVTGKGKSGIYVTDSDFNIIVGNTVDSNGESGIRIRSIWWSSGGYWVYGPCANNTVVANTANFNLEGIYLNGETKYTIIANNTLTQNGYGIFLDELGGDYPKYNLIYHNNFLFNTEQVVDENVWPNFKNVFDNGYPNGGNYWSNYAGIDEYRGVYQNETGGDGIGDTPYVINTATQDNYPFMNQNSWEQFNITEIIEKLNISISTIDFPEPPQNSNILWEKAISVNVAHTLNLSTFVGQLGVTGKLY
jgi:parallel beta-helix repeat protein